MLRFYFPYNNTVWRRLITHLIDLTDSLIIFVLNTGECGIFSHWLFDLVRYSGRGWSKELLAREVLAEIPDQLLSYMKSKGFQPPHHAIAAADQQQPSAA